MAKKQKFDPRIVRAHDSYVKAINSNDTAKVMANYDKDAQIVQPDGPLVHGHKAIEKWVADYFYGFKTHWVKVSDLIWVAGDFGFDQGHDSAVDTPIIRDCKANICGYGKGIPQLVKGILIYKKQSNGEFKVYRDIWNYNAPMMMVRGK